MTLRREVHGTGTASELADDLPYQIELWRDHEGEALERVLARASTAELARAIFKAAMTEYPARRITLRRGSRTMADSAG
jgi:hypothetical protein